MKLKAGQITGNFLGSEQQITLLSRNFSVTIGVLRITGNESQEHIAEHPSTQATGTWSFDLDVTHTVRRHFYMAFFAE
ncbi:MAG: hypothetical protein ACFFDT_27105 [Candidatus Hodarchaeota archaeon]